MPCHEGSIPFARSIENRGLYELRGKSAANQPAKPLVISTGNLHFLINNFCGWERPGL
jgi:hypothetical protein